MFLSRYFLPLTKENPADATIISHQLMLRAGLIRKVGSGIYNWLPLGLRVVRKITKIIQEELDHIGCLEIATPSMQPAALWQKSGRYADGGDLAAETLVAVDRHNHKLVYSPTAEEVFTELFGENIKSYKNLPLTLYQITSKFRDEIRPRYGVMRGREFLMKDAYSFDENQEAALKSYENMVGAYLRIFKRCGLQSIPVLAPTGSIGGNYSHEFHVVAGTGESTIYYDSAIVDALAADHLSLSTLESYYIREEEKHDQNESKSIKGELIQSRSIEVGHLFHLGDKYSKAMGVKIQNAAGDLIHPSMGCYGIGVSRLVGAAIEVHHDERGIIWPASIAPMEVIIINLAVGDETCDAMSFGLYEELSALGFEVLYDNLEESAGTKFARADLIGIPLQVVIGPRNAAAGQVEIRRRDGQITPLLLHHGEVGNKVRSLLKNE